MYAERRSSDSKIHSATVQHIVAIVTYCKFISKSRRGTTVNIRRCVKVHSTVYRVGIICQLEMLLNMLYYATVLYRNFVSIYVCIMYRHFKWMCQSRLLVIGDRVVVWKGTYWKCFNRNSPLSDAQLFFFSNEFSTVSSSMMQDELSETSHKVICYM